MNKSKRKLVAIHQPNFFPWLGYFDKITRCDVFILLDNVQYPKKGGTWCNRVQLLVAGQPRWVSMPVVRAYHGTRDIKDMQIMDAEPWRKKFVKTLETNYMGAPYYDEVFPLLFDLVNQSTDNLAEFNINAVRSLVSKLKLDAAEIILGSSLNVEGKATDLIIALTEAVGCNAYLCGGGAQGYQEDDKFAQNGIDLIYQNFTHPVYPQKYSNEFVSGLSIIDALMNCGFGGTSNLLHGGKDIRS